MIRTFKHKGLERFFAKSDHRGIPPKFGPRIERVLDRLDACMKAAEVDVPAYRFQRLKGERAGEFALSVSANWRITFGFNGGDAIDVNLEDHH